ncbi:hypothetical protein D9619_012095 [Psilocybe cf. subviscida]|uniref:Uncharacterized protein n=1 Tax=Psilocybe cf. subviscida TaxID=2480587 RepID=A0A8H5B9M9_9AGAR|nr:hypothetical protein D9619_012095 [Psilocybe cf. subviscida]
MPRKHVYSDSRSILPFSPPSPAASEGEMPITSTDDHPLNLQGSSFFSSAQNITISGGMFISSPTVQAAPPLLHHMHGSNIMPSAAGSFPASFVRAISRMLSSTLNLSSTSRSNIPDNASNSPQPPQSHRAGPSSSDPSPALFSRSGHNDAQPIASMSQSLARSEYCKTYQDMLGDEGHGLPLWVPSPNLNLHPTYRRNGVSIGDVGIFTPFGAFDFLFNIFKSADDPVNVAAAPDFQPLTSGRPELSGIQKYPYFNEGVHVASQSILTVQNASDNTLQFESQERSAVLVMPTGASIEFLANVDRVKKNLAVHAESFYRFVNDVDEGLGRGIRGGELCVIHTCVKSKTFALASIRGATPTSTRLSYRRSEYQQSPSGSGNTNLRHLRHGWDISGSAQGKVGPVEADYHGLDEPEGSLENQCLFVGVLSVDVHEQSNVERSKDDIKVSVSDKGAPSGVPGVRFGKKPSNSDATNEETAPTACAHHVLLAQYA